MRAYSNFEIAEARERERGVCDLRLCLGIKVINSSNLASIAYCPLTNLFGEGETAISDRMIKSQCQWHTIRQITYFELHFP